MKGDIWVWVLLVVIFLGIALGIIWEFGKAIAVWKFIFGS